MGKVLGEIKIIVKTTDEAITCPKCNPTNPTPESKHITPLSSQKPLACAEVVEPDIDWPNNRRENFYNYYNVDYRNPGKSGCDCKDTQRKRPDCPPASANSHKQVTKKQPLKYTPAECTRPGCLHWKPKGGVCKYDKPCKAHCYDHPFGVKPSEGPC